MEKDTALLLIVGLGAFGIYYLHNQRQPMQRQQQCVRDVVVEAPKLPKYSALKAAMRRAVSAGHQLASAPMEIIPTNQKMLGFASSDNNFFGQSANNHFA